MNFLHQTPNRNNIQKRLGFPYRMFMKSRFLILTLFCLTHLTAAFAGQQADVLKPYEGPSIHGARAATAQGLSQKLGRFRSRVLTDKTIPHNLTLKGLPGKDL